MYFIRKKNAFRTVIRRDLQGLIRSPCSISRRSVGGELHLTDSVKIALRGISHTTHRRKHKRGLADYRLKVRMTSS